MPVDCGRNRRMPPPVSIKLGRKSDEDLRQALDSHDRLQRQALNALRVRLQKERTERDTVRRDKQLNEYIVRKLETHRSESSGITIGGASEAFAWRNIEDKRDIDTRIKRFKQTEACEVIDVTAWALSLPEQGTPGSSRRAAKRPKKMNTSRISAIIEPRLSSKTVEGKGSESRNASPNLLGPGSSHGGHASFVGSARSGSQTTRPRSFLGSSTTAREAREPKPPAQRRNYMAKGTAGRRGQPEKKSARGVAGLRGQVSNVLLPSLAMGSGITSRGIQQCELDFMMLSYGKSHILLETLLDYGTEHIVDYGHRRVMFIEFIDYMRTHKISELSLVHFVHIVHPRWQRSGIPAAVKAHAPNLGWSVGLPFDLAECIDHIWALARTEPNDEGDPTISFDEFARLTKVESSFALDYADVRQMFYATDEDGNGTLDKHEFACFISGKVNVLDSMPPEQVVDDDGPVIPIDGPSASGGGGGGGGDSAAEDSGANPE